MARQTPDFTIGIEEEYLIVDRATGELAPVPDAMMELCRADLGDQVSPEYLNCQIEVGTPVCRDITEARAALSQLRQTVARHAEGFGLAPISASCHPFADWQDLHHTKKDRYDTLRHDLGAVARRMLICGMHVHVGLPDRESRIDLMAQFTYFLPHLLALSASSPLWRGEDTGLDSYRLTVFGSLPRTGLPPRFASWGEYERSVGVLTDLNIIQDSTKIWWDLRPSSRFPTLETRICDACPRLERTLTLAALTQATLRMLWRLGQRNQRWRIYDNFLIGENRWRAIRYGGAEGLIDFGARGITPFPDLVSEWLGMLAEDGEALGCGPELAAAGPMAIDGSAAQAQRAILTRALKAGASRDEALRAVVMALIEDFTRDL